MAVWACSGRLGRLGLLRVMNPRSGVLAHGHQVNQGWRAGGFTFQIVDPGFLTGQRQRAKGPKWVRELALTQPLSRLSSRPYLVLWQSLQSKI